MDPAEALAATPPAATRRSKKDKTEADEAIHDSDRKEHLANQKDGQAPQSHGQGIAADYAAGPARRAELQSSTCSSARRRALSSRT